MPKVSIVMPVYNSEKYVVDAIHSILNQTYTDFELIIINDCSTDRSEEAINSICDDRIVYIRNDVNKGFLYGLNKGIEIAQGEYIARLDDDDLSYPERIEKQVKYLDDHTNVVLLGTRRDLLLNNQVVNSEYVPIYTPNQIKFSLLFGNYLIAHSSFMMRKELLKRNNIQYEIFKQTPDYHMLLELWKYGEIDCLDEVLITWRIHPQQSTQIRSKSMKMEEEDKTRCIFINQLDLSKQDKSILKKAVCRELVSKQDYQLFTVAFDSFICKCKLDINNKSDKECIRFIWRNIIRQQRRNFQALSAAFNKAYRDCNWLFFNMSGIGFILRCILHKDKEWIAALYDYDKEK